MTEPIGHIIRNGKGQMVRISKFLRIATHDDIHDEAGVVSNNNGILGTLVYYRRWREWVLVPDEAASTVWSHDCLEAIRAELVRRNALPAPQKAIRDGRSFAQAIPE
jgi:hypothetical protein